MILVVAGSYEASSPYLPSHLLRQLRLLPAGSRVLLRAPRDAVEPVGRVELMAARMAHLLGIEVELCVPALDGGRGSSYDRDFDMVQRADRVLAYFAPERVMAGGTGHVIEAALNRDVTTEAWWVDEDGRLALVGDWP